MHDWKLKMQKAVQHFAEQLRGIRSGTISIGLIQTIRVDCQGKLVTLNRLGAVKGQGDRILITPFDRVNVPAIVRALGDSRLSAYALNPTTVSVSIPPLSVEQRAETARHVKKLGEEAKIAVRAIRQEVRKYIDASGRGSLAQSRKQPIMLWSRSRNWSRRRSASSIDEASGSFPATLLQSAFEQVYVEGRYWRRIRYGQKCTARRLPNDQDWADERITSFRRARPDLFPQ